MKELSSRYQPKEFEENLYQKWKEGGYFKADNQSPKEAYSIVMPPPNVTGALHMGHALNNTIQDILIRTKRLEGYETLWLPGTDHASISTEARVVGKLEAEGKNKFDLGREKFLEEAWDWTHTYGGTIKHQLEMLGCSCDWSREAFTLDDHLSAAVEEVFIRMYEEGLIYRGDRIVNYCPSCHTVISDAEVEHVDSQGHMWHIRYPFKDREGYITIATTRPETLLGDLAVAVNPEDERYQEIIGEKLVLPLVGREIPIIADDYVDSSFGTGMVKITPSHDPNDFEVGERHGLGQCMIMTEDASIVEGYGPYSGKDRYVARQMIVEDLEQAGLLVEVEDHEHAVGHCERCGEIIEPLLSKQYFVRMKELARPALEAYRQGQLKIIPQRFGKIYEHWLENIRDWTISRQLWWGHRIPIYYHKETGEAVCARENPDPSQYIQDEDTLDTWFSSALWPFSTLGWPEETPDFQKFFPTNVLVTGYDIIFFWVIRMVFSSLYNTGELPFSDVFFNGIVLDAQGRKMSKSLGNGVDPLDMIDRYGTDALRFTLVTGNSPGSDIRFREERIESSRNFANKLWNASRFVLMNLKEDQLKPVEEVELTTIDQWILARKNQVAREVLDKINHYEIGQAADLIHDFIWNEYCDWYIELVKPHLFTKEGEDFVRSQSVLAAVLKDMLIILHPFMPFITEEIYQQLPMTEDMLIVEAWPSFQEELVHEAAVRKMTLFMDTITSIRNARSEMDIAPSKKADLIFVSEKPAVEELLRDLELAFRTLGMTEQIVFKDAYENQEALVIVKDGFRLYLPLEDLVDYQKELDRLRKDYKEIQGEIKRAEGMLANQGFLAGAPQELIDKEKEKLERFKERLVKIQGSIEEIEAKL